MRRTVSFHPVDPSFFEGVIEPLVAGEKINPEPYLEASLRQMIASWESARYKQTLDFLREQIDPPPPPEEGSLWDKVRTRLERYDHKPSPLVRLIATKVEPELHLHGRPFLVTEGSPDAVAKIIEEFASASSEKAAEALIVDQLAQLDPEIAKQIELSEGELAPPPGSYRNDLLQELRVVFDQSRAARAGQSWGPAGERREPARDALIRELAWRAVQLHSRAVPFWVADDVDGLETVCLAADVEPPSILSPAWPLLARSCDHFPELRETLSIEMKQERSVGAYVAPHDVQELIDFLSDYGARIIQAASRHGVGATCKTLLRKIRECACYAQKSGGGYLEASGIQPIGPQIEEFEDDAG